MVISLLRKFKVFERDEKLAQKGIYTATFSATQTFPTQSPSFESRKRVKKAVFSGP